MGARLSTTVLFTIALVGNSYALQKPQPTFRASTSVVVQVVRVTDRAGAPIKGLKAEDFVLTEDGRRQEAAFLEYQEFDNRLAASVTAAPIDGLPSAERNTIGVPGTSARLFANRKLVILYVDLQNMPFFDRLRTFAGMKRYLATHMSVADTVAIMTHEAGRVKLIQDFTDRRAALDSAVSHLIEATEQEDLGVRKFDGPGTFGESADALNLFSTDRQLAALQRTANDLGSLPQLKTLIYFGSGLQFSSWENMAQLRATINAAVRANVTLNPIDARGLIATMPLGDASRPSPAGVGMFDGSINDKAMSTLLRSQDLAYAMAKDTGGIALFDSNDLSQGIVRATRAVSGHYILGFYSTSTATDGRFRRISINLRAGLPGALSYRPGYFGPKGYEHFSSVDKERQLEEALGREDPLTDIPMALDLHYFQINRAEYFVPISLRMPGDIVAGATGGRVILDLIAEVKTDQGLTIRNLRDKLEFRVRGDAPAKSANRPVQYETGFSLIPGNYEIKLLVRDQASGRIGTFLRSFSVPNLERQESGIRVSSVVLGGHRVAAAEMLYSVNKGRTALAEHPFVHEGQMVVPSLSRVFERQRPAWILCEIYQLDAERPRPVASHITISKQGFKVLETPIRLAADDWRPGTKTLAIRTQLPLDQLESGTYDVQLTLIDIQVGRAAFWRASVVIVEPTLPPISQAPRHMSLKSSAISSVIAPALPSNAGKRRRNDERSEFGQLA